MTLTQLQAFVAVVETGTFTAGAHKIGMSQPAISDLIKRLERELGSALFQRAGRSVMLTEAGRQLLPHAQRSVSAAEEGARAVRSAHALEGGTATFGLLANAPFYMTQNLAKEFRAIHPQVRIRLTGQNSAETAADVAEGAIEAGIVTLPVDDHELETFPLMRDEIVYVTADPSRARQPVTIEALCDAPLVLYPAYFGQRDPALRQLHQRAQLVGRTIAPSIEVEHLHTAAPLVAAGHGDTIACRASIKHEIAPLGLHCVSFAEPLYDTLAFIKRRNQPLSPATREFARIAYESLILHQRSPGSTVEPLPTLVESRRFFLGR